MAREERTMTLRGHIRNGTLVFDEPPALPEGAAVEVDLRPVGHDESGPTLYERLKDVIGTAQGLPHDMAENHDHYIHGTPKRDRR